jgi:hypothetical protein
MKIIVIKIKNIPRQFNRGIFYFFNMTVHFAMATLFLRLNNSGL